VGADIAPRPAISTLWSSNAVAVQDDQVGGAVGMARSAGGVGREDDLGRAVAVEVGDDRLARPRERLAGRAHGISEGQVAKVLWCLRRNGPFFGMAEWMSALAEPQHVERGRS